MTTDDLRHELDRVAASAPVVDVPDDTWTRARRSALRDRAVVGVTVALAVTAVAGAVAWLPDRGEPPVATTESGALPSRIWTVPEELDLPLEADLAVGPLAAAYISVDSQTAGARMVGVSAKDGSYVELRLPGPGQDDAVAFGFDDQLVELSPDGSKLAYSTFPGDGRDVAVADLVAGTVRFIPLGIGGRGIVRRLIWSPGGEYLVWWGQPHSAKGFGNTMAGLIGPGATTSTTLPEENQDAVRGYAVADDGRVALIDRKRVRVWQDGRTVEMHPVDLGSTVSESAHLVDGGLIEVRHPFAAENMTGQEQDLIVRHEARVDAKPFPTTLYSRSILGWTTDGAAVVQADADDDPPVDTDLYRVAMAGDGTVTTTRIVTLESTLEPERLTVATDLPIADFPEPDWAEEPWWRTHADVVIGLCVAAAIGVPMGLRWGWRRYRAAR
jgi:hypothetical protein